MTSARDIWAVLPVKEIGSAKSRLARDYSAGFRRDLARAMLTDVLNALTTATGLAGIVIASVDRDACALASQCGARVFEDGARGGHTQAVMSAARHLSSEGRAGMLTLPADIPAITAAEISGLLAAHGEAPAFTIVPSHDRRGSNAIVVSRPDAVELAFGDDSFVAHLAAAQRAGIEPTILSMPGIGLDIDHPADLARFMQVPARTHTSALLRAQSEAGLPSARARMQASG